MKCESRPNSHTLLQSWRTIWSSHLQGKRSQVRSAIQTHVALFPTPQQAEVRARTEALIRNTNDPAKVRAYLRRTQAQLGN